MDSDNIEMMLFHNCISINELAHVKGCLVAYPTLRILFISGGVRIIRLFPIVTCIYLSVLSAGLFVRE